MESKEKEERIKEILEKFKWWIVSAVSFIIFLLFMLILPKVVGFVVILSTLWVFSGLAGFGIGSMMKKVEIEGVFYKNPKFFEHIVKGPITIYQYLTK